MTNLTDSSTTSTVATVPIKSAWLSKINWTQLVSVIASLLALKGIDLDAQTQANILAGIVGINAVVTFVMRTWFNGSVNVSSLPTPTQTVTK
jgi:hypothetical protein